MWKVYFRRKTSCSNFVEIGAFGEEDSVDFLLSLYADNFGIRKKEESKTMKRLTCLSYCELIAVKDSRGKEEKVPELVVEVVGEE